MGLDWSLGPPAANGWSADGDEREREANWRESGARAAVSYDAHGPAAAVELRCRARSPQRFAGREQEREDAMEDDGVFVEVQKGFSGRSNPLPMPPAHAADAAPHGRVSDGPASAVGRPVEPIHCINSVVLPVLFGLTAACPLPPQATPPRGSRCSITWSLRSVWHERSGAVVSVLGS